jgi:hypothetical protein
MALLKHCAEQRLRPILHSAPRCLPCLHSRLTAIALFTFEFTIASFFDRNRSKTAGTAAEWLTHGLRVQLLICLCLVIQVSCLIASSTHRKRSLQPRQN